MLSSPYEIIWCSWPRPAEVEGGRWTSDPEWDAPEMTSHPGQCLEWVAGHWRWVLDWSGFLHSSLIQVDRLQRDLRGFHAVWRLRMRYSGTLVVPDGGSWIRCDGRVLHCQRRLDMPGECEVRVRAGEVLEVAQVHGEGRWRWWAGLQDEGPDNATEDPAVIMLQPYLARASAQLNGALGPPLKVFSDGRAPLRLIVAIYSMILNGGCAPVEVYLFGEHQWDDRTRALVARLLPFARVVATTTVLERLHHLGGPQLVRKANRSWVVLKLGSLLLMPPTEFCAMDDDVLVLDRIDDALQSFKEHNLVYLTDQDWQARYFATWGSVFPEAPQPLPTARLNAGLCWIRNQHNPKDIAERCLQVGIRSAVAWEQGFSAMIFANDACEELPLQRYVSPIMDGIPGGIIDYNYQTNPCRFAAIHLCGFSWLNKLSDGAVLLLAEDVLMDRGTRDVK